MENLRKENEMLRDKIKRMVWNEYCCICDQPMDPNRDRKKCHKCGRKVCYWCNQDEENFAQKYELCKLCIEKMENCAWCGEICVSNTLQSSLNLKCIGCNNETKIPLCCNLCKENFYEHNANEFLCIDC